MACDMPEPCKFPCLDSCQKRFLWTHKEVDLAPHPVVGPTVDPGLNRKISLAVCVTQTCLIAVCVKQMLLLAVCVAQTFLTTV